MGLGGSADIFQAQIMDLMASLKFVRAYMDDLLIIMRRTLDEHLQKMETVLTRLRDAGLKVNAAKSSFCAHEIEYLGYILTRGKIKPQPKKVHAILALNPPNNVKELRHFLRMVQYYQDKWALSWQSQMLACRNKGQNDRHVSVRPTCCRHVGQHVSDTTQKAVDRGTGPT